MYTKALPLFFLLLFSLLLNTVSCMAHLQPRQSITPPPECDVIPTWEVTNFLWYNSSHNLDCANQINIPDVCFNSTPNGLVSCDGNLSPCDRCGINGCYTGLPAQPAGYGPPDNIQISINVPGYTQCQESNPQSIRRYEVGDGLVLCGGVAYHFAFVGDSNAGAAANTGHIDFAPLNAWACTNGSWISGSGSVDFELDCAWDEGNNATCVVAGGENVVIPLLDYQIV